jgi:SPP1 family predicted phage head-tail adaptor
MNIETLKHRIDIYEKTATTNTLGETDYDYASTKTIWASIIPQTAKLQIQVADTILSNVTHKIVVRYKSGSGITQDMYVMYGTHRFDIKYILNPYFANETLEIFVTEVME